MDNRRPNDFVERAYAIVDALIEKDAGEMNTTRREEVYVGIQRLIWEDVPSPKPYTQPTTYAWSDRGARRKDNNYRLH